MTDEQIDALMNAAITGDEEPRDAYRAIFRAGIREGMLEAAKLFPNDKTHYKNVAAAIRQAAGEP